MQAGRTEQGLLAIVVMKFMPVVAGITEVVINYNCAAKSQDQVGEMASGYDHIFLLTTSPIALVTE